MSRQDAEDVIGKMAKYDDFFVNLMMNEELGLQVKCHSGSKYYERCCRSFVRPHLPACEAHVCLLSLGVCGWILEGVIRELFIVMG